MPIESLSVCVCVCVWPIASPFSVDALDRAAYGILLCKIKARELEIHTHTLTYLLPVVALDLNNSNT